MEQHHKIEMAFNITELDSLKRVRRMRPKEPTLAHLRAWPSPLLHELSLVDSRSVHDHRGEGHEFTPKRAWPALWPRGDVGMGCPLGQAEQPP